MTRRYPEGEGGKRGGGMPAKGGDEGENFRRQLASGQTNTPGMEMSGPGVLILEDDDHAFLMKVH